MKHLAVIYSIIIVLCSTLPAAASGTPRSLWVWESHTRTALNDEQERARLLDFAENKNIDTLYVYADYYDGAGYAGNDVVDNPGLYRTFIADAHSRGMEVHALLGSQPLQTWEYFLPEKRPQALAMITNVLDYNAGSAGNQTFDGFNVDIEPYIVGDWWSQQPTYAQYYMDMLSEQKQLIATYGQDMQFGPVIPRWYEDQPSLNIDWNGVTQNLLNHILDVGDYITIMDYRNEAEIIINDAEDELAAAEAAGKEVVVGIETAPTPGEPYLSFDGFTEEEMEAILAQVEAELELYSSYSGIAIHNYDSYYKLTIPEPASIILILAGLTGLIGIRKKKF